MKSGCSASLDVWYFGKRENLMPEIVYVYLLQVIMRWRWEVISAVQDGMKVGHVLVDF